MQVPIPVCSLVGILLVLSSLLLLTGCGNADEAQKGEDVSLELRNDLPTLTFAFYNVENLFDPADDPVTDDEDFTPNGSMKWDLERLDRKCEALSRAIRSIDDNNGPDILGLCEVENRRVLEILVDEFLPQGMYGIVHRHSPDGRGIDVALLYRKSAVELVTADAHPVGLGIGQRPTRDILEVRLRRNDREFTVLVNHWPSRSGGQFKSEPRRFAAATVAAGVIDAIRAGNPSADIVMMGDFNDEPDNRSVSEVLSAVEYRPDEPFSGRMINLAAPLLRIDTIGSYLYKDDWEVLDQIMVSPGLLDSVGLTLVNTAQRIHAPDFLRDHHPSQPMNPPRRTYVRRSLYIGGTSDHFPVYATFGWAE